MERQITTLFFVDEHRIVRAGLRHVVRDRPDLQVVGEASDQDEAIRGIRECAPDVVVSEIQTPRIDGLELIREARLQGRSTRFVIFSALEHRIRASEAMRAGASAYLLKSAAASEVLAAIDAARAGGLYLSPSVGPDPVVLDSSRSTGSAGRFTEVALSRRQREILRLVAEGYSTREIGDQLGLKDRTVESHRHALMKKLNVHRVAHLVRYAIRENLVAP
ncbi:MAG: LuxR C-terminal-related transcriptional regulator [Myxococcota bacterium]